jgi:hypothetical protein
LTSASRPHASHVAIAARTPFKRMLASVIGGPKFLLPPLTIPSGTPSDRGIQLHQGGEHAMRVMANRHVVKLECFFENDADALDFILKLKADNRVEAADSTVALPDGRTLKFDRHEAELREKLNAIR